jgi:tRNA(Ile)-lysidine synthase
MIDAVRETGLLAPARRVVVLLSGGRDSVCLLDLAARIAGADAVQALHVNYGLRDAADEDERHCALLCERIGVPLEVRRPSRPERGNLQAWARDVRYAAAGELAGDADMAAGHTATDQVETILYRLASSPSRRALLGMKPRDGRLVRPLLRFTRAQTRAYCLEQGLDWREDETNDLDTFARGRIRAELVPALNRIHPAAEQNVLALAELLRDEGELLDALVDETLGGRSEIAVDRLRRLPAALQRLVVQRLADGSIGRPAPGAARRIDEIVALPDRGTAALDLPHGVTALAKHGVLRFAPTSPKPPRAGAGVGSRTTPARPK